MSLASLAVQLLNGLASASSLFLISAGLTLIFGVTRIVNFAHGSFFMLGAYVAYTTGAIFGAFAGSAAGFVGAVLATALAVGVLGALIEIFLLKRLYPAPELLQLTATFGVVLIVRDAALALWGPEDRLGPRVAGLDGVVELFGHAVPEYDLFLLVIGPVVLVLLTLLIQRTRFGMVLRAASENRVLAAALGIDQRTLFTVVFALGSFLAGLAGALTLPREPANLGMDLSVIADAFVVTVLGGLGSVPGAFIGAIIIGVTKALCIAAGTVDVGPIAIAFPRVTLVIEFVVMALVLLVRPSGLLGRPSVAPATTNVAIERALVQRPGRGSALVAIVLLVVALLLPTFGDQYLLVLATDILVAALFTASLRLIVANGGMTSFGHAASFGLGAYTVALAVTHGVPFGVALVLGPLVAALAALAFAALCVRMSGIYFAMLTLAFAQILWSIAVQWDSVTGGSNGIIGVWPPEWLGARTRYYLFVLVVVALALAALSHIAFTPFGYALRGARDSALRAEAIGVDVRARRIRGLMIVGAFAGLAGALFAFSKGGVAPDALSIPRSVDVLVMMLLGGMNALFGPLLGAIAFTWLSDVLARYTDYWRAGVGIAILLIVSLFPFGIGGAVETLRSRVRFRS
ncbi:MAG TPA: ABC transporter permease [Casimicrobiaceae bacterium]|nr:ABC transporter permease [Casimicrobiaceae bacterium]